MTTAAYGASIYQSIDYPIDTVNINRARLRGFNKHKEMVKNHKETDSMPGLSKTYTTAKLLDQFPMYLRELHRVDGITLSYVIRVTVVLPSVINAPIPRIWSGNHTSMMEGLISYTPHNELAYDSDNV